MIRTERLCLRRFQPGDSLTFLADPEVVRFEAYPPLNEAQQADTLAARIQDSAFLAIEFGGRSSAISISARANSALLNWAMRSPARIGTMALLKKRRARRFRRRSRPAHIGFTPNAIRKTKPRGDCWSLSALRAKRISAKTSISKRIQAEIRSGRTHSSIPCSMNKD